MDRDSCIVEYVLISHPTDAVLSVSFMLGLSGFCNFVYWCILSIKLVYESGLSLCSRPGDQTLLNIIGVIGTQNMFVFLHLICYFW